MRIRGIIFKNLSRPIPIMAAANVPPNTISRAGIINNALKVPPSKKNEPKIAKNPRINPKSDPYRFSIMSMLTVKGNQEVT